MKGDCKSQGKLSIIYRQVSLLPGNRAVGGGSCVCAALLLSLRLEQRAHTESPIQALEEEE